MRDYLERKLKGKIFQSGEIQTVEIPFSEDAAKYCRQNKCGRYGTNWTCPPAAGDFAEIMEKYLKFKKTLVYSAVYTLEDSFDIEGMDKARKSNMRLCDNIIKSLLAEGKAFSVLKSGSCAKCKKCSYPDNPCRYSDIAFPSMEAAGVDVAALAKKLEMKYYNGENTVTYFTMFFYD